jgi:hypothetical protein
LSAPDGGDDAADRRAASLERWRICQLTIADRPPAPRLAGGRKWLAPQVARVLAALGRRLFAAVSARHRHPPAHAAGFFASDRQKVPDGVGGL